MTTSLPGEETTSSKWWQVRPEELAARFEWDADALMDALNPEDFTDEQAALALDAIAYCRGELPVPSSPPGQRSPARPRRARKGALLPLDRYRLPLLRALIEGGGSLPARDAVDAVGTVLAADLTQVDQEPLRNGSPRWRDRVQHARLRLTAQGLIARDSPWGVWRVTDEGRQLLRNAGRP
jgi:hypothetical protein